MLSWWIKGHDREAGGINDGQPGTLLGEKLIAGQHKSRDLEQAMSLRADWFLFKGSRDGLRSSSPCSGALVCVPAKDVKDLLQHGARARQGGDVDTLRVSERVRNVIDQACRMENDILHRDAGRAVVLLQNRRGDLAMPTRASKMTRSRLTRS